MAKVVEKKCPVCEAVVTFEYIGATVGGGQLYSCPVCHIVIEER